MIERGDNKGGDNITVWMCLVVAHSFTVVVFAYISLFVHLSLSLSLSLSPVMWWSCYAVEGLEGLGLMEIAGFAACLFFVTSFFKFVMLYLMNSHCPGG